MNSPEPLSSSSYSGSGESPGMAIGDMISADDAEDGTAAMGAALA